MDLVSLLYAKTFWTGPFVWTALSALCLFILALLFRYRRRAVRALHDDRSGAAVTIDFLVIAPVALFVIAMFIQAMILAHQSVIVHVAAFAAGRSALVHKCPPPSLANATDIRNWTGAATCSDSDADALSIRAARTVLIAAAPASSFARERGACNGLASDPLGMLVAPMVIGSGVPDSLRAAIDNKVCYVLESGNDANVRVETRWMKLIGLATSRPPPLTSKVSYRYALTTPIGVFLAQGRRGDNTRWREGWAEVRIR